MRIGVDVSQRLSLALFGKAAQGQAKVGTGLGKSHRPGFQGGLRKRGRWERLNGHVPRKRRNSQAFA